MAMNDKQVVGQTVDSVEVVSMCYKIKVKLFIAIIVYIRVNNGYCKHQN